MVEDGVLRTEAFKAFAKDYVMFLHVTTMIEGRKDDDLLPRLGAQAFPFLVVMDVDGSVLREHRTQPTVEAFKETAAVGVARCALRTKADAGDREAILALAFESAASRQITSRKLKRLIGKAGALKPEEEKRYKEVLTKVLLAEAEICAKGAWYARMENDGLVPTEKEPRTQFYLEILKWAEFQEQVATYARALEEMRKLHGENERAAGFFTMAEKKLAELKEVAAPAAK